MAKAQLAASYWPGVNALALLRRRELEQLLPAEFAARHRRLAGDAANQPLTTKDIQ